MKAGRSTAFDPGQSNRAGPVPLVRSRLRRGSLLAEVAMATVMLMIAMTLTVKVLGYVGLQRRMADHRQRAVLEVANLMERLTAHPFEEITPELAHQAKLSPSALQALPGAELAVEVGERAPSPGPGRSARRVAIRLRWRGRSGDWESPVRLTTWIEQGRPAT
jgi:hypothetical protein